MIVVIETHI